MYIRKAYIVEMGVLKKNFIGRGADFTDIMIYKWKNIYVFQ